MLQYGAHVAEHVEVCKHHAFRTAGGAGGIDERREIASLRRRRQRRPGTFGQEGLEGNHPGVSIRILSRDLIIRDHDELQIGKIDAGGADALPLKVLVSHEHLGARV